MIERPGELLARHTTMRVGGPADRFVVAETAAEIIDIVRTADERGEPLLLLGGGSNVVVADEGFPGTVLQVAARGMTVDTVGGHNEAVIRVAAGESWDDVVEFACGQGWAGVEALSGIPGSAGATPIQNVGAYGQEIGHCVDQLLVWDRRENTTRTLTAEQCRFGYRHSALKATDRFVVVEVTLVLRRGGLSAPVAYADLARQLGVDLGASVPLARAREAVLAQRRLRGMVLNPDDHDTWSCGSFFTNPVLTTEEFAAVQRRVEEQLPCYPEAGGRVKTSAAWLIDHAGFGKGYGAPRAATLSTKHTLAITNRGSACARDVIAIAREIREGVYAAFGVHLVNEPVLVGLSL